MLDSRDKFENKFLLLLSSKVELETSKKGFLDNIYYVKNV